MKKILKTWSVVGAALVTSTAVHAAQPGPDKHMTAGHGKSALMMMAQSGEGGEGGEGGEAGGSDGDADIADFLTDLGLIEGHLAVGYQLFNDGKLDMAKTHMKHPKDEIYSELEEKFEIFGKKGFADELQALADAVESNQSPEVVMEKYEAVRNAIIEASELEDGHERVEVIANLVRTAGEEFAIGVKDGQIVEVHEYQDAWGFVNAAKRLLDSASDEEKAEYGDEFSKVSKELAALDAAWPTIDGSAPAPVDSTVLAGAAARIEIISVGMH